MALFYAALAFLLGLALGRTGLSFVGIPCPLPAWLWLLPLLCLPATPLLNRLQPKHPPPPMRWPVSAGFIPPGQPPSWGLVAGLALCLLAGGMRYAAQPFTRCWTPADLAWYNAPSSAAFDRGTAPVIVTGYVAGYPEHADDKLRLVIDAATLERNGQGTPVHGRVRVTTAPTVPATYGQPVRATGRLVDPGVIDGFSYRDYLAVRSVSSVMYAAQVQLLAGPSQGNPLLGALYAVRARGERLLQRALPEPYASLANGMLLGIDSGIPAELDEEFKRTGASHVIVISGTNVALLSGVMAALATRLLGRSFAVWPILAALACYALLVGGDTAVLRAALMGGLFVIAAALNRRSTALVSLALACAAITLANPLALWDVGFELSAVATAGLILFSAPCLRLVRRVLSGPLRRLRALGEDVVATTLAATAATTPLMLFYFGRLSLVSLLTNVLIAPVQPLILFGGSLGLGIGLLGLERVAQAVLWLPLLGLIVTVAAVQATAALPFAAADVPGFGAPLLAGSYALLAALKWQWWRPRTLGKLGRWLLAPAALMAAGACAALLWLAVWQQPDGRLHVWFLDVGQGDAILIQTPSGRQVLVDGGPSPQALFSQLGAVLPFWDRSLDLLVLTHPDGDHMAGQADVPLRFAVADAWATAPAKTDQAAALWLERMRGAGIPVQAQAAGGAADLGDGVTLTVLSPPIAGYVGDNASNRNSLVARLSYGSFSVLLTGDADTDAEAALLATHASVAAAVLKVGHHGSRSSTSPAFAAAVNPQLAVIQVGQNRYGHPNAEVLARLAGMQMLRTDQQGRIHVASDGQQVWVEAAK